MKVISKIIYFILIILIINGIIWCFYNQDKVYLFYQKYIIKEKIILEKNDYYKYEDYIYVKNTNDFIAKNEAHLTDIFYTIINSGANSFTFYCDPDYTNCIDDVKSFINNKTKISNINNFVHPYNSFEEIVASYTNFGQVKIDIKKKYNAYEIEILNSKINYIIKNNINENMTDKEKIKVIHDYIINNSNYAKDNIIKQNSNNNYDKANGNLLEGYGLCSGYADSMALFLEELDINNYKIASKNHVWNLVNVDNKWLHLDLTWDDPVTSNNIDYLDTLFFLISDNELKNLNVKEHDYDKEVYKEAI